MKLYISGPMTGYPDLNREAFRRAEMYLVNSGFGAVNPADCELPEGLEWGAYLRHDLKLLVECTGIVMLPGHQHSKGARLELYVARALGMAIYYLRWDHEDMPCLSKAP